MKDKLLKKTLITSIVLLVSSIIFIGGGCLLVYLTEGNQVGLWFGVAFVVIGLILLFLTTRFIMKYTRLINEKQIEQSRLEFEKDLEKLQKKREEAENIVDEKVEQNEEKPR